MLALALSCSFGAGGELLTDSDAPAGDTAEVAEDTAAAADDTGSDTPDGTDVDQDGWTLEDGDCDDEDAGVHPEAYDGCDGADEACDDAVDEDAAADDAYDPNEDLDAATDLGSLEDDNARTVTAWLHNDDDLDYYVFSVEDHWYDLFDVHIALSNIPETTTYRLTLYGLDDKGATELDAVYGRGSIELLLEDGVFESDGGDYALRVEALADPDCGQSYLLTLERESF